MRKLEEETRLATGVPAKPHLWNQISWERMALISEESGTGGKVAQSEAIDAHLKLKGKDLHSSRIEMENIQSVFHLSCQHRKIACELLEHCIEKHSEVASLLRQNADLPWVWFGSQGT